MKVLILCSFLILLSSVTEFVGASKNVICYFASWTVYRNGNGSFDVKNIDPSLCTHLHFGFIGLNEDASIHILDSWESDASGLNGFNNLVGLKKVKPELKVFVSMGGWNEGSKTYSFVAANETLRKTLANNVLTFLEDHGFDGFDLDWEYPSLRGGNATIDKDDFTALLKELKDTLKPKGKLLSAAVAGAIEKIDVAYDVQAVSDLLDIINVMVFDYHGSFENFVGHIAPLYPALIDYDYGNNKTDNVDSGIQHWISLGADPEKIHMGIILYGRSFTLADKTNTSLYAPILGGGKAGPYSSQSGILGYNEICAFNQDTEYVWDDEQKVPHRIWDDQWVGFEDERSISLKVEYALEQNLAGAMIWSLDYDDFRGTCGEKYPLLTTINKGFNNL